MEKRLPMVIAGTVLLGAALLFVWGLWELIHPQVWLLRYLRQLLGSWGPAIMMAVVVNRVVFLLVYIVSLPRRSREALKPEIAAIESRYANDEMARSTALVNLYRKHGITSGSLLRPLLVIPVLTWVGVGLYVAMWRIPDLHGVAFWWIPDLSAPDPLYLLPLIHAALVTVWRLLRKEPERRISAVVATLILAVVNSFFPACWLLGWCVGVVTSLVQRAVWWLMPKRPGL